MEIEKSKLAVEIAGLTIYHVSGEKDHRNEIDKLRPQLQEAIAANEFERMLRQGRRLNLETTAQELLIQLGAST